MNDKRIDEKAEAQVKASLKSEEEIKKYTWDEKQPLGKTLVSVLSIGTSEQKNAVLNNLPMYCDKPAVSSLVFTKLCVRIYYI